MDICILAATSLTVDFRDKQEEMRRDIRDTGPLKWVPSHSMRLPVADCGKVGPSLMVQSVMLRRNGDRSNQEKQLEEDMGAMVVCKALESNPTYRLDVPYRTSPQQKSKGLQSAASPWVSTSTLTHDVLRMQNAQAHNMLRMQNLDPRVQGMMSRSLDGAVQQIHDAQVMLGDAMRGRENLPGAVRGVHAAQLTVPSKNSMIGASSFSGVAALGRRIARAPPAGAVVRRSMHTNRESTNRGSCQLSISPHAHSGHAQAHGGYLKDPHGGSNADELGMLLGLVNSNGLPIHGLGANGQAAASAMCVLNDKMQHEHHLQLPKQSFVNGRLSLRRLPVRPSSGQLLGASRRPSSGAGGSGPGGPSNCNPTQNSGRTGAAPHRQQQLPVHGVQHVGGSGGTGREKVGASFDASAANTDEASGNTTPDNLSGPDRTRSEQRDASHADDGESESAKYDAGTTSPVGGDVRASMSSRTGWATQLSRLSSSHGSKITYGKAPAPRPTWGSNTNIKGSPAK